MELMRLGSVMAGAIDMNRVKARAEAVNRYERTFRAEDFEQSSRCCEQMLKEAGFSGVERYALKMDGKTANMDCIMPQAWSIRPGSFCRIEDGDVPEERRMIADYAADHFSCGIWSAPTPPEGIRAELIDSRSIADDTDLTGKFILATEACAKFYKLGVQRGASGILMFDGSAKAAEDFPDFRRWGNGIGLTGWYHAREDRRLVVYHVTPRQGEWLHERLKKGPLHLHAVMNSKIFDGEIWTVTGVIPGEKKEEIVLLAHLYEPFLTDDALGPASCIEICTVLRELAEKKVIGPLKKSLRVVFSMELFGFSEYFSRRENVRRAFYAVSLDGIGTFNTWKPEEKKSVNLRLTTGTAPFVSDLLYREYFREKDSLYTPETRGCLSDDTFGEDPMIRKICGGMPEAENGIPVNWLRTCILPYHHNTGPMFNSADWDLAGEIIQAYCTVLGIIATEDRAIMSRLMFRLEELADQELAGIFDETQCIQKPGDETGLPQDLHHEDGHHRMRNQNRQPDGIESGTLCFSGLDQRHRQGHAQDAGKNRRPQGDFQADPYGIDKIRIPENFGIVS